MFNYYARAALHNIKHDIVATIFVCVLHNVFKHKITTITNLYVHSSVNKNTPLSMLRKIH